MQSIWARVGQANYCGCRACLHASNTLLRRSTTAAGRRKPTFGELFTAFYTSILGTAAVLDAKRKDTRRRELESTIEQTKAELARLKTANAFKRSEFDIERATSKEDCGLNISKGASTEAAASTSGLDGDLWTQSTHNSFQKRLQQASRLRSELCAAQNSAAEDLIPSLFGSSPPSAGHVGSSGLQVDMLEDISRVLREQTLINRPGINASANLRRRRWHTIQSSYSAKITKSAKQLAKCGADRERVRDRAYDSMERSNLESEQGHSASRPPKTARQKRMTESQVSELVDQLLAVVAYGGANEPDSSIFKEIRKLQQDSRLPHFDAYNTESQHTQLAKLHDSIRTAFEEVDRTGPGEMVGRICHNLIVARVPPTADTFNLLILGFDRHRCTSLSTAVVSSFFSRSRVLPNQQTIVCLLNHYMEKQDCNGFAYMIARLLGKSVHGMNLRRKATDDVNASEYLKEWAARSNATEYNGFFVEPAVLGWNVLDLVIRGLTQFRFLEEAAHVLLHCVQYSVKISADTVHRLFDKVVTVLDPRAAAVLLNGLASNLRQTAAFIDHWNLYLDRLSPQLYGMLGLYQFARAAEPYRNSLPIGDKLHTAGAEAEQLRSDVDTLFEGLVWPRLLSKRQRLLSIKQEKWNADRRRQGRGEMLTSPKLDEWTIEAMRLELTAHTAIAASKRTLATSHWTVTNVVRPMWRKLLIKASPAYYELRGRDEVRNYLNLRRTVMAEEASAARLKAQEQQPAKVRTATTAERRTTSHAQTLPDFPVAMAAFSRVRSLSRLGLPRSDWIIEDTGNGHFVHNRP